MALFRYKAVNAAGDVAAGEIEAANEAAIVDLLRDQGLMPTRVEAATGSRSVGAAAAPRRQSIFAARTVTRDALLGLTREQVVLYTLNTEARTPT